MNGWLFVGIGITLFTSALILSKEKKRSFDFMLIGWLISNSAYLVYLFLNFEKWIAPNWGLLVILNFTPLLTAPLLFFYVKTLVSKQTFSIRKNLFHFLPYLIMTGSALGFNFIADEQAYFSEGVMYHTYQAPYFLRVYGLVMAFFSFLYPMFCLYLIYKHRARIKDEFSFQETITLGWLNKWIIAEIVGFWITFLIIWAGSFQFIDFQTSFSIVGLVLTFNIFFVGFFGLKQQVIFTKESSITPQQKYQKSSLSPAEIDQITTKLNDLMASEKPFLNAKLDIYTLAEKASINKHQLSQAINLGLSINFYDYVNSYRIGEFKRKVKEENYGHLSLLGIALESGFNSKSSFNLVFKKNEGMTPSAFKKSLDKI
jgi:AraC-like DNA-binding protein